MIELHTGDIAATRGRGPLGFLHKNYLLQRLTGSTIYSFGNHTWVVGVKIEGNSVHSWQFPRYVSYSLNFPRIQMIDSHIQTEATMPGLFQIVYNRGKDSGTTYRIMN